MNFPMGVFGYKTESHNRTIYHLELNETALLTLRLMLSTANPSDEVTRWENLLNFLPQRG